MPITRLSNGKLVFYAHVPKCAGSAVEDYLHARFGRLGMIDRAFSMRSPDGAWTRSPPQHMPEVVRRALLPDQLFDAIFATVRHPVRRLVSVFRFQKYVESRLPTYLKFERWLEGLDRTLLLEPYALDGHLRPMTEIVPQDARVFRVEDGLDSLVAWLDEMAGDATGPRRVGRSNVLSQRAPTADDVVLTPALHTLIYRLYAADYARFGYDRTGADMQPVQIEAPS